MFGTYRVNHIKGLVLLVASLLMTIPVATQARGESETVLAGIDIFHSTIADIVKLYGPPEGVYAAPEPYPAGTKQYKWGRLTVTLKVLTEPTKSGDQITAIQIDGEGDGKPISRTGRGLKLNDKQQEIKKIYGVEPADSSATLEWPDGVMLLVRTNAKARVDRLELTRKPNP